MGGVGIALAMIGVVICPITSGDTAFRSARLTLADWFKIDQDSYANRLKLCIPVLGVGAFLGIGNALGFINYTVIWRYFSWTNQTLAMIVLWEEELLKSDLKALNADVQVSQEEYDEVVAIKSMFLLSDYQ